MTSRRERRARRRAVRRWMRRQSRKPGCRDQRPSKADTEFILAMVRHLVAAGYSA